MTNFFKRVFSLAGLRFRSSGPSAPNPQLLIRKLALKLALLGIANAMVVSQALAQGQDSTPAERDIMILGELLPGLYDNSNQAYFDVRLKRPDALRHKNVYTQISRFDSKHFGAYAFAIESGIRGDDSAVEFQLFVLEVDNGVGAVRMKIYRLKNAPTKRFNYRTADYLEGCDILWRQEASQFRGLRPAGTCDAENLADDMMLSDNAFWLNRINQPADDSAHSEVRTESSNKPSHFALDRARIFNCYADLPGVGGGRDIPYERYPLNNIHDLGGEQWFTDKDGKEIGVSLFRVMWTFNNYDGVFTRPSFVVYVKTKKQGDKTKELGYAWTEPTAQRIGINLKWVLVNCYMLSSEDVTPFFKGAEPKVN